MVIFVLFPVSGRIFFNRAGRSEIKNKWSEDFERYALLTKCRSGKMMKRVVCICYINIIMIYGQQNIGAIKTNHRLILGVGYRRRFFQNHRSTGSKGVF